MLCLVLKSKTIKPIKNNFDSDIHYLGMKKFSPDRPRTLGVNHMLEWELKPQQLILQIINLMPPGEFEV